MANIPWLSRLAFADESTPGDPPANAAAWATETSIQHIRDSLSAENLFPEIVEDMRSQIHVGGNEVDLEGLRNGEFGYSLYLTGTGTTTTAGTQVAETALSRIVENWCGGIHRTNSTDLVAAGSHSATAIEVTADTDFAEGACIGWEHPDTGEVYIRRLVENTGTTVWTLDEALPQAADDGDVIHGAITLYQGDTVLASSNAAGRQLSYLLLFGEPTIDDTETFVTIGCVNNVTAFNWTRNEGPTIDVTAMWSNIVLPHESPPTSISWSDDPEGVAPAVVGPEGRVFFQDVGTTTQASFCLSSLSFNPGLTRSRVETVTEQTDNMQGTCHFSVARPEPEVTFVLTPWGTDELDDWEAGTFKQWRTQAGTTSGFVCALGISCASVRKVVRAVQNDSSAREVTLKPHLGDKDTDNNPFTTDTELTRTPWYVALA